MYSIATSEFAFLQVCKTLEDLKPYIERFVANRRKAEILKNGEPIGWIGPDLTQRIGWGYYIDNDLIQIQWKNILIFLVKKNKRL